LLKLRLTYFLSAIAVLAFTASPAAEGQILGLGKPAAPVVIPTLQPPDPSFVFPTRQTLTFSVDWRVFTAGTAVFHLEQNDGKSHGDGRHSRERQHDFSGR